MENSLIIKKSNKKIYMEKFLYDELINICKEKLNKKYPKNKNPKSFGAIIGKKFQDKILIKEIVPLEHDLRQKEPYKSYMEKMISIYSKPCPYCKPEDRGWVADIEEVKKIEQTSLQRGLEIIAFYHMHRCPLPIDMSELHMLDAMLANPKYLSAIVDMTKQIPVIRFFHVKRQKPLIAEEYKVEIIDKYSRQIALIGLEAQKRLANSCVLIVGVGGLGGTIADSLVRAGVGKLILVDRDFVEMNNLQRQVLFNEKDIGKPKAIVAKDKLDKINSFVEILAFLDDFNPKTAFKIVSNHKVDLIIDGTDNFETRMLINDLSIKYNIPWIMGSVLATYGYVATIIPTKTPCYNCIIGEIPNISSQFTCETTGVLNSVVKIIASIETTEAIKILINNQPTFGLIFYDAWSSNYKIFKTKINPLCNVCQKRKFMYLEGNRYTKSISLCGRNAVQIIPHREMNISFKNISKKLKSIIKEKVNFNKHVLKFKVDSLEVNLFKDGRAIIQGTNDINVAKSIYNKYIGG